MSGLPSEESAEGENKGSKNWQEIFLKATQEATKQKPEGESVFLAPAMPAQVI